MLLASNICCASRTLSTCSSTQLPYKTCNRVAEQRLSSSDHDRNQQRTSCSLASNICRVSSDSPGADASGPGADAKGTMIQVRLVPRRLGYPTASSRSHQQGGNASRRRHCVSRSVRMNCHLHTHSNVFNAATKSDLLRLGLSSVFPQMLPLAMGSSPHCLPRK